MKVYNAQYAAFSQSKGFEGNSSGAGMAIFLFAVVIIYALIIKFLFYISFLFLLLYIIVFVLYGTEKGIIFTNYIFDFFGANPDKERDLIIHTTLKKIIKLTKDKKNISKKIKKLEKVYSKNNDKKLQDIINKHNSEIKQLNVMIYSLKREIVKRVKEINDINTSINDDIPKIKGFTTLFILISIVLYSISSLGVGIRNLHYEVRAAERKAKNKILSSL